MPLSFPFDPVLRSEETETLVMRGESRLYSKFRPAPYYGGIATADAVGCSFLCAYCWNYGRNENPSRSGSFYSPEAVAAKLLAISRRHGFHLFRVTGSEPILGEPSFRHLIKVIEIVFQESPGAGFILETNGFMLGYRETFAEELRNFPNLLVRVAIKGVDPGSFERITGVRREFFIHPLKALKILADRGVRAWPAVMEDLFSEAEINLLRDILGKNGVQAELELECLEPYPFVLENMKKRGVGIRR